MFHHWYHIDDEGEARDELQLADLCAPDKSEKKQMVRHSTLYNIAPYILSVCQGTEFAAVKLEGQVVSVQMKDCAGSFRSDCNLC